MKKMAMMVVAAVAAMSMATSVFAQAAGPKGGGGLQKGQGQGQRGGGMRMMGGGRLEEQIVPKLKLNAEQKKKWDAVNKEIKAEIDKVRAQREKQGGQNGQGQRMSQQDREKMMAKFKSFQDKKMAILNKDQKSLYEKLMKEARDKMMKERGPGGPGGAAGKGKGGNKGGGSGGL